MERLTKDEIIEILRFYWKSLSRKTKPRSFENGIWKKIEWKLKNQLKELNKSDKV